MTDIKVRMDRGGIYSTVHGERAPDDPNAATHFIQDGLPFDAEGHLIADHEFFEAHKGDRCSPRAAELRGKALALIAAAERKAKQRAAERRRVAEQDAQRPGARRTLPRAQTVAAPPPPPPAPSTRIAAPPPASTPAPSAVLQIGGDNPPAPDAETLDETDIDADAEDLDNDNPDGDQEFDEADDDGDDEDNGDDAPEPNIEAYLRGEEEIQWHILTQLLARRYSRRFGNLEDALEFLVEAQDGPKVVPFAQLKPAFQKKLK